MELIEDTNTPLNWPESAVSKETYISGLNQSIRPALPKLSSHQATQHLEQHLLQVVHTSHTSKACLLELTRALGEAFLADSCMVGLKDQNQAIAENTRWYVNGTASFSQKQTIVLDILDHPTIHNTLRGAEPVAISNLRTSAVALSGKEHPVKAVLVIQTLFQQSVNGVIILTRSQPHNWTEADVKQLKAASKLVAIAISQRQLEQRVQQQQCYQSVMEQVTATIRSHCSLEQTFQTSLEGLVSALQITRGFILLLKYTDPPVKGRITDRIPRAKATVECQYSVEGELSQFLETVNSSDAGLPIQADTQTKQMFWVSECRLLQQIFVNQAEPIAISSPYKANLNQDGFTANSGEPIAPIFNLEAMPSLLLVPLEHQGTVLGCLALQHRYPRSWHSDDLSLVKLIAAQLSTAIIQTSTLRQVQSLVEERTVQLQHSLDVQAKLYQKTRQQVDQLRQLNQIMEDFLSTMSHELLTPLTSMTLAIRMLRQAELSADQRNRYLEILERQCAQETNLINDLLVLQQLESDSATAMFQPVDVRYLIRDVVQPYQEAWIKKGLELYVELPEHPLNICTDADSLTRILKELLTNAGKYADSHSVVRLNVAYPSSQPVGQMVLTLSNIGAKITPEEMPYIFDKFRRGQGVTQQAIAGTGLGLALVKGLVEHLNGAIVASSVPLDQSPSWETCFTLTLPQSTNLGACI